MRGRQDWFRNAEWSAATQEAFWRRLERSRSPGNKAQCLRIQASHLQQVGSDRLLKAALELLDHMLDRYPERTQLAAAHRQRAMCLSALGEVTAAVDAFRASLEAERAFPGVQTGVALDYAAAVVRLSCTELYEEILALLEEFKNRRLSLIFPVDRYRLHGLRAAVLSARSRHSEAVTEARLADQARRATQSGLRYHKDLGLVHEDSLDPATSRLIARLAQEGG